MECYLCNDKLKDKYIVDKEKYYCLKCNDIKDFLEDVKPKKQIIKKIEVQSANYIKCIKCNKLYIGKVCPFCNCPNPLYINKKKKR